jgi:tRNA(adenine34) deaminase
MHITKKNLSYAKELYYFITLNHLNDLPIAALIIENNTILCIKKNNPHLNTPLAHAECQVIHDTLTQYKRKNLINCVLITSLEPCLMCTGAAMHAKIKLIYYLCRSPDWGIHTKYQMTTIENLPIIPILDYENEINILLKEFFNQKRM